MPKQNFSPSPAGVAQVTVTRDSQDDVQTRQIIVSLDGERKGGGRTKLEGFDLHWARVRDGSQ